MKLTKVRKQALEWFRDHDAAKLFPASIQRRTINDLVNAGLLRVERPEFGFALHYITDAGRKALQEANDG